MCVGWCEHTAVKSRKVSPFHSTCTFLFPFFPFHFHFSKVHLKCTLSGMSARLVAVSYFQPPCTLKKLGTKDVPCFPATVHSGCTLGAALASRGKLCLGNPESSFPATVHFGCALGALWVQRLPRVGSCASGTILVSSHRAL